MTGRVILCILVCAIILVLLIQHGSSNYYRGIDFSHNCGYQCCTGPYYWVIDCVACPTGEYKVCRGLNCEWCPPDYYQDQERQGDCKQCPDRTTTFGQPRAESEGACVHCPANTYFQQTTIDQPSFRNPCLVWPEHKRECVPCGYTEAKNGYRSLEQKSEVDSTSANQCHAVCRPGSYFDRLRGYCPLCERGSYSDTGIQADGACKSCPAGSYQDEEGATGCKACWSGTYSPAGSDHCPQCEPGTYNNQGAVDKCSPCSPGLFQDEKGQVWCKLCPKGSYNPRTGSPSCLACPEGKSTILKGERRGCINSDQTNTYDCTLPRNPCNPIIIKDQIYYAHSSTDKYVFCEERRHYLLLIITSYHCLIVAAPTYLGCFRDRDDRDLSAIYPISLSNMTPELCYSYCRKNGYKYAGVQFKSECFCDNSHGKYGKIDESQCSSPCAGDGTRKCGGSWANSIYELLAIL